MGEGLNAMIWRRDAYLSRAARAWLELGPDVSKAHF
jgi:hypothetical protein